MTLEGAINFSENSDSIIYTMNSNQTGQYCAIIPKNTDGELSMLIDMNMKSSFDSLMNNNLTKEELIDKINEEYRYIKASYPFGMLILPMLDINLLESAINSNDKQKMFDETKKIGGITSELYKKLTDAGVEKSKINQKITIIETTESDTKFVEWLKNQMPNFVDGVTLEDLKTKYQVESIPPTNENPFANINPFTNVAVEEPNKKEDPQPSTTNIFETPTSESISESTNKETTESSPEVSTVTNNIFESPTNEIKEEVTSSEPNQTISEPKPIQNTPLENTTIITPTDPLQPTPVPEQATTTHEEVESAPKSGGFANLLILLVILIGVTIVSIELGKFLYNTYGA